MTVDGVRSPDTTPGNNGMFSQSAFLPLPGPGFPPREIGNSILHHNGMLNFCSSSGQTDYSISTGSCNNVYFMPISSSISGYIIHLYLI